MRRSAVSAILLCTVMLSSTAIAQEENETDVEEEAELLSSQIEWELTANRNSAVQGDVVDFRAEIGMSGESGDAAQALVFVAIPPGFRLVDGVIKVEQSQPGGMAAELDTVISGQDLLTVGLNDTAGEPVPFHFTPGTHISVHYQLAVGTDVAVGQEYIAWVEIMSPNTPVLPQIRAERSIRVTADSLLDEDAILGRVYCDQNENGLFDEDEVGLQDARLYLDNGHYVTTDPYGRFHFSAVGAGTHYLKVDDATFAHGSYTTTGEGYLVDSVPASVSVGVYCVENIVDEVVVTAPEGLEEGIRQLRHEGYFSVQGRLDEDLLLIDGAQVPMVGCQMELGLPPGQEHPVLGIYNLDEALRFRITAEGATNWQLVIENEEDEVVWRQTGRGSGRVLQWDGRGESGLLVIRGGESYRINLTSTGNNATCSAPVNIVGVERTVPTWLVDESISSDLMDGQEDGLNPQLSEWLDSLIPALEEYPDNPLVIEVHHDDSLEASTSLRLTSTRARQIGQYLGEALGRTPAEVVIQGYGSQFPQEPNVGDRARGLNRRILVRIEGPPHTTPAPEVPEILPESAAVSIDEQPVQVYGEAVYGGYFRRPVDGLADFHLLYPSGMDVQFSVPAIFDPESSYPHDVMNWIEDHIQQEQPEQPDPETDAQLPETGEEEGTAPDESMDNDPGDEPGTESEDTDDGTDSGDDFEPLSSFAHPTFGQSGDLNIGGGTVPGLELGLFQLEPLQDLEDLDSVPEQVVEEESTEASVEVSEPEERVVRLIGSVEDLSQAELEAVLTGQMSVEELLQSTAAAVLEANLPQEGAVLEWHRLPVWGTTYPDNQLTINGESVAVGPEGEFRHYIELEAGDNQISIHTLDPAGAQGLLEWQVELASKRFFLMAMGQGAMGTSGARIPGASSETSLTTDSDIAHVFYGSTRLYFKMWLSGQDILDGYFDEVEITTYLDTSRNPENNALFESLIQPDRRYPVYGDLSEEVADVEAQGKFYLLIEADESQARWGSFNSGIVGGQLMHYERTLEGAQILFDDALGERFDMEARLHWADDENSLRHAVDVLRGTGGSLYYLRYNDIIEGSEQISLVVRDRNSGLELYRQSLGRNEDYTIRYAEGRVFLMSPLPTSVDSRFITSTTSTSRDLIDGHEMYLEVSYDYESDQLFGGNALGAYASETFDDWLEVGVGYVSEGRADNSDPSYHMWGINAEATYGEATGMNIEFSRSTNVDTQALSSDDGGLTYQSFNIMDEGEEVEGTGLIVSGHAEISDFLPEREEPLLYVGGYLHDIDPNFHSAGSIMDQGSTRFGFEAHAELIERSSFRFQHDGSHSVYDLVDDDQLGRREIHRQSTLSQYQYTAPDLRLVMEYGHTFWDDSLEEDGYHTDLTAIGLAIDPIADLTLSIDQEVIIRSDDPHVIRQDAEGRELEPSDRFSSAFGLSYNLMDDLEISASEYIRYSGETATTIGLSKRFSDHSQIYIQDRLESYRDRSGTSNSVVIGGEDRYGEDGNTRSYSEYQVGTGVRGETNRALMGVGRHFEVLPGLTADLSYEHTELMDPIHGGESSRNAGSLGWEFLGLENVIFSSRLEFRLDNGNPQSPQVDGCLSDGLTDSPGFCRDMLPGGTDRLQFTTANNLSMNPVDDVTLFLRYFHSKTGDLTLGEVIAKTSETTFGLAYRPVSQSPVSGLMRYTYLDDRRPSGEVDALPTPVGSERERSHVLSLVPIIDIDQWRMQLVEKLAFRRSELGVVGLPSSTNNIILWINRINYHITDVIDASLEYRRLSQSLVNDSEGGFLLEGSYIVQDNVRVGLGYNFTSFTDDELSDFSHNESGVYFRVTGMY